ncbi:MAG: hypothetical protein M1814_005221 [Vezdaea aestivalis]|nr:MAG: hypothetical protein M1814_005221 [Vezdaea aestivalis]
MLSSLFTSPQRSGPRATRSPFSSPIAATDLCPRVKKLTNMNHRRRASGQFLEGDRPGSQNSSDRAEESDEIEDGDEEEDDPGEGSPLLPIFSAAHLDSLPVYNITHAIRILIATRCETTLTWDQLRSPQVSQFLVKPIQQQIRTQHFSRATIYALTANCLQFVKESHEDPGNSGTSRTRAFLAELLAIKLLKEFSTRELIDALSYNFDPLQGYAPSIVGATSIGINWDPSRKKAQVRAARVSTLEVAIRAQAKHLLAHPLVVRQLEAIWAGTIVFHSAADSFHRATPSRVPNQNRGYGTNATTLRPTLDASPDKLQPAKQRDRLDPTAVVVRRSVTLYDPRDASMLKLSRLRVPRYRQFLSTCSLAVLLALYLAVLIQRSLHISALEIFFWFWSAGFMLDEIVGFNDQGFSLYILSIWNTFDLGILLLLIVYYAMRIWGLVLSANDKVYAASMAYDVLAANAILLFPRLFSVLDHYRYFSQLLIAFRLMVVDLVACFILIIITCSGFFVAFTLSFGSREYDPKGVVYSLFQMLFGFTPAAWNAWDDYNLLGKVILTLFLFICHFLIVTILITVLTNSFMAIVANANEEHQFVFAINVISTVKSDALFSYVAPTNILAWALTPLRYFVPFRRFVKINRTVIKVTHFPILFAIFAYEKIVLSRRMFNSTDLIESMGPSKSRIVSFGEPKVGFSLFSPTPKIRTGSVASFRKDLALDEVFRRPNRVISGQNTYQPKDQRQKTRRVDSWMQGIGSSGNASPPVEDDQSILDRLERRKLRLRRSQTLRGRHGSTTRDFTDATRSVASDPEDFFSNYGDVSRTRRAAHSDLLNMSMDEVIEESDADADADVEDETPNQNDSLSPPIGPGTDNAMSPSRLSGTPTPENLAAQLANRSASPVLQTLYSPFRIKRDPSGAGGAREGHSRDISSTTVLFAPIDPKPSQSSSTPKDNSDQLKSRSGNATPHSARRRSPLRPAQTTTTTTATSARPILPRRAENQSVPNLAAYLRPRPQRRHQSSTTLDMMPSSSDDGSGMKNFRDAEKHALVGGLPSSFATQMAFATGALRPAVSRSADGGEDARMMSRLMLARMKTLEEGLQDVIREVKGMSESRRGSSDEMKIRPFIEAERLRRIDTNAAESSRNKGKGREVEAQSPRSKQTRNPRTKARLRERAAERRRIQPNSGEDGVAATKETEAALEDENLEGRIV